MARTSGVRAVYALPATRTALARDVHGPRVGYVYAMAYARPASAHGVFGDAHRVSFVLGLGCRYEQWAKDPTRLNDAAANLPGGAHSAHDPGARLQRGDCVLRPVRITHRGSRLVVVRGSAPLEGETRGAGRRRHGAPHG